jgi:PhoPQ-activated pathogenicity-related protein
MFRWRWVGSVVSCLVVGAAGAGAVAAAQERPEAAADALAAYVAKPDDTFTWRVQRRYRHPDAEVLELYLQSQTWQGTLWKHQVVLIKPRRVSDPGHAALVIGGGRWRDGYEAASDDIALPEDGELFVAIARALRSTVVVMGGCRFNRCSTSPRTG